jgi:anti-sigma B factor antagonist
MIGEIREENGKLVAALTGEIDLDNAPEVRRMLLECTDGGRDVLVDLSGVSYIDSSGIASLVEALQNANSGGGALDLVAVSPQAMRVFELARLDKVFTIHPDLGAALAAAG